MERSPLFSPLRYSKLLFHRLASPPLLRLRHLGPIIYVYPIFFFFSLYPSFFVVGLLLLIPLLFFLSGRTGPRLRVEYPPRPRSSPGLLRV